MRIDQIQYNGANLSAAQPAILGFPVAQDETVKMVIVRVGEDVSSDAVFNLQKNGTDLFDDELTIPTGEKRIKLTGLNLAFLEDDVLTLDFISGAISSPVTLSLGFDESSLPDGDLNAATNTVEKIQGVIVDFAVQEDAFADSFDSISETDAKWRVLRGSSSLVPSDTDEYTQSGGSIRQTNPIDGDYRYVTINDFYFNDGDTLTFNWEFFGQYGNKTTVGFGRNFVSGFPQDAVYFDLRPNGRIGGFVTTDGSEVSSDINPSQGGISGLGFLRFRRDGNNIIAEKSGDNSSYTQMTSYSHPSAIDGQIKIFFGGTTGYEGLTFYNIFSSLIPVLPPEDSVLFKDATSGKITTLSLAELKTKTFNETDLSDEGEIQSFQRIPVSFMPENRAVKYVGILMEEPDGWEVMSIDDFKVLLGI